MPTGRDLHIDVPLSNMTVKAFNDGLGQFIGQQVMPTIPVGKESDKYYQIDKEAFFRIHDTRRSRKTEAHRIEFNVSSDSYFADEYALAAEIALQDLANADKALGVRMNHTRLVQVGLLRDLENRVANIVTSISNIGSGVALSASQKWGNYVESDPIAQVTSGHAFIVDNTGIEANTMIIDKDTFSIARRHPVILDMFKYTNGGLASEEQLREVFGVSRILVGKAKKEMDYENVDSQASSMVNIWGNNVVLAYIDPTPGGMETVTFGAGFRWTPDIYPSDFAVGRQQFSGPGTKNIEVLEGGYHQDEKVIARDLAYALTGTL